MSVLITAVTELFGLFVEDGSLAIAILIWVAISAFAFPAVGAGAWQGPAMFIGLVLLLVENVLRSARKHRAKRN